MHVQTTGLERVPRSPGRTSWYYLYARRDELRPFIFKGEGLADSSFGNHV